MASDIYGDQMVTEPLCEDAIEVNVDSKLALLSDYTDELAQVVDTAVTTVDGYDAIKFSRLLLSYYLHLLSMRVDYVNNRKVAIPPKTGIFAITPHMCAVLEKVGRVDNEDKALTLLPKYVGPSTFNQLKEALSEFGIVIEHEDEAIIASSRLVRRWLKMAKVTLTTEMPVDRRGDWIFMWLQVMADRSIAGDSHSVPKSTTIMALTAGITQTANLYKPTLRYCSRNLGRRLLQLAAQLEVAHE